MKLTKIETSPPIRIDTTVGTRVFAGDQMIHGDTGWRDISGEVLVPTEPGTRVFIRRTGAHVYLSADILRFSGTVPAASEFLAIPDGFRAVKTFRTSGAYEAGSVYSQRGGSAFCFRSSATGSSRFYVSYLTDNPWPISLPGTPA